MRTKSQRRRGKGWRKNRREKGKSKMKIQIKRRVYFEKAGRVVYILPGFEMELKIIKGNKAIIKKQRGGRGKED